MQMGVSEALYPLVILLPSHRRRPLHVCQSLQALDGFHCFHVDADCSTLQTNYSQFQYHSSAPPPLSPSFAESVTLPGYGGFTIPSRSTIDDFEVASFASRSVYGEDMVSSMLVLSIPPLTYACCRLPATTLLRQRLSPACSMALSTTTKCMLLTYVRLCGWLLIGSRRTTRRGQLLVISRQVKADPLSSSSGLKAAVNALAVSRRVCCEIFC